MNFLKSVILGLCVSVVAYFALFSLALVLMNILPVIKFLAIGAGCGAMIYYMRRENKQDVQDPE